MLLPRRPPRVAGDLRRTSLTAFAGDSITVRNASPSVEHYGGLSYATIAEMLSGGVIKQWINAGVSGNRSDQLLARISTDVINYRATKPGRCIVLIGTNDVSTGSGVSRAQSLSNIGQIYDLLRAANIEPVGATIPPKNGLTYTEVGALNVGIKHLCDQRGMHCLDFHSVLVDGATGDYLSGYTVDGIHPVGAGTRAMANLVVSTLGPRLAAIPNPLAQSNNDGSNLVTNGFFIGDANSDGVADSWTLSAANGTVTPTIEMGDANILGNWQVLTTTVAGQRVLSQNIVNSATSPQGWADGDWLEFSCLMTSVAEAGAAWPTVQVNCYGASLIFIPVYQLQIDVTRGVAWLMFQVPTGASTGVMKVEVHNSDNTPKGTGTVKLAQMSLYNLTRLGLA